MVERIVLDPSTNSQDKQSFKPLETVQTKVNHFSTMVARSNDVHTFAKRMPQIPYSWIDISDTESEQGDETKERPASTRKNSCIPHEPRVD
jgi:hypothetical protein